MSTGTLDNPALADLPHLAPRNSGRYNLTAALYRALKRFENREYGGPYLQFDGLELECSQEIQRRSGVTPRGLLVPLSVAIVERRSVLDTTAGAGSIPTFVPREELIDVLRGRMVTASLGAQVNDIPVGLLSIPRRSATSTPTWVAEGAAASTETNMTADQVAINPHTVTGYTDATRKYLRETWANGTDTIAEDLIQSIGLEFDRVALVGSGSAGQPTGIANQSGVVTVPLATNGRALTFADLAGLEKTLGNNNADSGVERRGKLDRVNMLGFVTTPNVRAALRQAQKFSTASGAVWTDDDRIIGKPAYATSLMPSNGSKGSTSGTLSSLIYGQWNNLILGHYGVIDILVNPYTFSASGVVRVRAYLDCDVQLAHAASFLAVTDIVA